MESNVAAAAVAAVVATGITLIVTEIRKAKDTKAHQAEVADALQEGYRDGWYQGRESVLQHFQQTVTPQEFIPSN